MFHKKTRSDKEPGFFMKRAVGVEHSRGEIYIFVKT